MFSITLNYNCVLLFALMELHCDNLSNECIYLLHLIRYIGIDLGRKIFFFTFISGDLRERGFMNGDFSG